MNGLDYEERLSELFEFKKDKESVLKTQHFCMLPWLHLHIWPDSTVHYCCISDSSLPMGRYDGNIKAIYNSNEMKQLRLNMLANKPSQACARCYAIEKNKVHSLRMTANGKYAKYFDEVKKTNSDGSVDNFTMRYMDIRFSNRCNLRCRSCGPDLSSSWYPDQIKIFGDWPKPQLVEIQNKEALWQDLLPFLNTVEDVYFAGGEPLITNEVYDVLDYWIEKNRFDVKIGFTTNFSILNYKERDALSYFNKFPKLVVSASLDDSGLRAEYLRKGTKWSTIVENRKKMIAICPKVSFELTPTISVFNVWHFPEFHNEWLEMGFVGPDDLRMNLLTDPDYMSIKIIPPKKRALLVDIWSEALDRIMRKYGISKSHYNKTINGYRSVITSLQSEPYEDLRDEFFKRNNLVDSARQEDLYDVYPELRDLLRN